MEIETLITATNPFSAMGLPVERVDEQTLRTCFRRLALCVHPDKSDDPRADQAFKVLMAVPSYLPLSRCAASLFVELGCSQAFETLQNEAKQTAAILKAKSYISASSKPRPRQDFTPKDVWEEVCVRTTT